MPRHPIPTWGSKLNGVHWPSARPPYSPPKIPTLYLWLFSAVLGPLVGQSPSPRCPSLSSSSFSSLDWGVGRAGKEEGEGEIGGKLSLWGLLG